MPREIEDTNVHAHRYNAADGHRRIRILDSTLREGEQHPGVSFTTEQRIRIARELDAFGVDQIEISPVISPDHERATKALLREGLRADIVAHVRALRSDLDRAIDCDVTWVAAYMSVSEIHLAAKLKVTRDDAKSRALEVADYIKAHGLKSRFTMEDASRAEPAFLVEMCQEMNRRGIERIGLPDTVGILRPRGMYNMVKGVLESIDPSRTSIDVHCHNDLGLALANALAGCEAGAEQIHTSIDGYGERAGIPALAETAVVLTLLYGSKAEYRLDRLRGLSETVSQATGLPIPGSRPIVGDDAFKHKAGTHTAAVLQNPATYEILEPKSVGNRRRIVLGPMAGKNGIGLLLSRLGLDPGTEDLETHLRVFKELRTGDLFELSLDEKG